MKKYLLFIVLECWLCGLPIHAYSQQLSSDYAPIFNGDIGMGVNYKSEIGHSNSSPERAIPYANFDYGRLFARVDTFGIKLTPMGYGDLELVTRVIDDGYTPSSINGNLNARQSSVPIGLGTLQITPIGGILFNVFHDANKSKGNLIDLILGEELKTEYVVLYPQIGAEYRSHQYVNYFYGVSSQEAAVIHSASYLPGSATNLFIDLLAEVKISGCWYLDVNLRKTWLDSVISTSPLVDRRSNVSGLLAVSYRFQ